MHMLAELACFFHSRIDLAISRFLHDVFDFLLPGTARVPYRYTNYDGPQKPYGESV